MADIRVERKSGAGWIWWVVGLIVLALLAWMLFAPDGDDDVAVTEPVMEAPVDDPIAPPPTMQSMSIAQVLSTPSAHVGEELSGTFTVGEVPTDRGFWISEGGPSLFAVLNDGPMEVPLDINPGQQIRMDAGMVRDSTHVAGIGGVPLDDDTRAILDSQPIFLTVDEDAIQIVEAGTPQ